MQNAAYTISQGLPRLHQSIVTHKVSCLPGCCQILKVCEENNGDHTLRTLFGYCPKPTDGMLKHLRGAYSEDRNHVCHVLTSQPHVQTRQAIRAVAWTDVPTSLSVFMSQRKRWSMGATVNDLRLVTSRGTHWFERIRAFSNVQTWFCNIFIMGSIAGLIHAAQCKFIFTMYFNISLTLPSCPLVCYRGLPRRRDCSLYIHAHTRFLDAQGSEGEGSILGWSCDLLLHWTIPYHLRPLLHNVAPGFLLMG
jgi:hypothetical protein